MNRKIKKLFRNPNLFFYDYFAKRLGAAAQAKREGSNLFKQEYDCNLIEFDGSVNPWLQLAKRFDLRTGATTGLRDQSLLINSLNLLDIIRSILWMGYNLNCSVKVYTLGGGVNIAVPREKLLLISIVERIYKEIRGKPDFVVEFICEFENNYAAHFFIYDFNADGLIVVRSRKAYIKKATREVFLNAYPEVAKDKEGKGMVFETPFPVDVVYTWVNKDDPEWIKMWSNAFPGKPVTNDRFASKDELRYSLRSLAEFMPWVHRIYIVTNCARPAWFKETPRISWVAHENVFPDKSNLPVFNSHAIEACLHRIPNLSENFIYFNDDIIVTAPCSYYDFFDQIGRTVARLEPYGMVFQGNNFDASREYLSPSIKSQLLINDIYPFYMARSLHRHVPHVLKKSVLEEIECKFSDHLCRTRSNKIRSPEDINLPSFFYHHYALASGRAIASYDASADLIVRPINITKINDASIHAYKFLCFNDGDGSSDNEEYGRKFTEIMTRTFPMRCDFEISLSAVTEIDASL